VTPLISPFVATLLQDIQTARQKGQHAVESTSARKDAKQSEGAAQEDPVCGQCVVAAQETGVRAGAFGFQAAG
jgi:hypothetical protein